MPNPKFTTRLRTAVDTLQSDPGLQLVEYSGGSLFSPVAVAGTYKWAKVMDSDGLLVAARTIQNGEGGEPERPGELLLGVVMQSEDSTSQTKPNPFGKAALTHVPNGIWVNVKGEGRRRLDRILVLFVLPKGAAPKQQRAFASAKRNVENAAKIMPDVGIIEVARGESSERIAELIRKRVRPFLRGRGRPATE